MRCLMCVRIKLRIVYPTLKEDLAEFSWRWKSTGDTKKAWQDVKNLFENKDHGIVIVDTNGSDVFDRKGREGWIPTWTLRPENYARDQVITSEKSLIEFISNEIVNSQSRENKLLNKTLVLCIHLKPWGRKKTKSFGYSLLNKSR